MGDHRHLQEQGAVSGRGCLVARRVETHRPGDQCGPLCAHRLRQRSFHYPRNPLSPRCRGPARAEGGRAMKTAMLAIFALAVIGCSKSEPSKPTSALILGRWTDTKDIRDAHQKEPATVEFFRDGTALLSWRFTLSGETHVAKHLLHWTFVESHRMKYEDRKGRLNMA